MFEHIFNLKFIEKFLRFGIVGFIGFVIDFGLTYLFKEKLKLNKFVANAIGFSVAAVNNYILNRVWTFRSQNPNVGREFFMFILISLVGLAINTLVIWFFVKKCKFNFYFSKLIAVGVVMIWNFILNLLFTFV